jgi:hypothetical protein
MFRPDFRLPGPFAGVPSRVQSGKGALPGGRWAVSSRAGLIRSRLGALWRQGRAPAGGGPRTESCPLDRTT